VVWNPTVYTVLGVVAAALFFVVAVAAWQHRSEPGARAFLGLITCLGGWALVYGIQLGFTTLEAQLAWQRLALAVGGAVPTLWFYFAVRYTNRDDWLTLPVRTLLVLDPLLFGLLALTNPSHGLVWQQPVLVASGNLHVLEFTFGAAYLLHLIYTYLVTPVGFGLLALATIQSSLYRTQGGLLVVGAIPPLVANGSYALGLRWPMLPAIDLTPFAFVVTGPCFALALFRFDLLERVPVARQRVLSESDDGFVVLDECERIVTYNPTAAQLLDAPVEGAPFQAHLPTGGGGETLEAIDGTTLSAVVDRQQRVYDVRRSTLSDHHDRVVGYIVRYRNVTDRHTYEQRLRVANRVLRHNLRNRLNVVTGWAERLHDHEDPDVRDASERITETAESLVSLGEQIRLLVETADYAGETAEVVVLRDHLAPLAERLRQANPDAVVESKIPPSATVIVPNAKLLAIAVENVLENAIQHNDAERPWVRLTVEEGDHDEYALLRVADNGPGIPETEREVLRKGIETPLEHGSGLGLWLVYWTVTAAGGEVSFEAGDGDGSVVTLALPSDG
jgi:signal transduction histidine kinase